MGHPLFVRPWRELAPLVWASYIVGPLLLTVLVVPVDRLTNWPAVRLDLYQNMIGSLFGIGTIHLAYAAGPWLFTHRITHRWQLLIHGAILVVGLVVGAELSRLWHAMNDGQGFYRLQYFRFGAVYAGVGMFGLVAYDRMRGDRELARREARLAQLEALQIRTNPHFLFNALNTISCLVGLDPAKATEGIERMSDLFRFIVDLSDAREIALETELAIVERYLEIEALRYDGLQYELEVEPEARAAMLPPLLVQPLVENAVKHGIAAAEHSRHILVSARVVGDRLLIMVSNNMLELSQHVGTGRSQRLIRQRLRLAYGGKASLRCGPSPEGRYVSSLRTPLVRQRNKDSR